MTIENIKNLIFEEIDDNKAFNTGNKNTDILNVEHAIGKYHAYMEILDMLSTEEFINVAEKTKMRIEELMQFVEKIYQSKSDFIGGLNNGK